MKAKLISFVVSETLHGRQNKTEAVQISAAKSAPHYFEKSVPRQTILERREVSVGDKPAILLLKAYHSEVTIAEVRTEVRDIFTDNVLPLKQQALQVCRAALEAYGGKDGEFSEEYSVFLIAEYKGSPNKFLTHRQRIVGLLKSEHMPLNEKEIDYTLSSQLQYAKDDLVIIDWDGAFVFDPDGDFEQELELLEIANMQLLRYRLLDRQLDVRLHRVGELAKSAPARMRFFFKSAEVTQALRETIIARSVSIAEFQDVEREIKLIGDWYPARLYELVGKKFKFEEWRRTLREKLEAMQSVYTIAAENFTVSWERRARIIEQIGWYILLVGWLVLLMLDVYFYKK